MTAAGGVGALPKEHNGFRAYEYFFWKALADCTIYYPIYFTLKLTLIVVLGFLLGPDFNPKVKKGVQVYLLSHIWGLMNTRGRVTEPTNCILKHRAGLMKTTEAVGRTVGCLGFAFLMSFPLAVIHDAQPFSFTQRLIESYVTPPVSVTRLLVVEGTLTFFKTRFPISSYREDPPSTL
eukprot:Selendium_serpulae@DN4547_c0_g1_i1.p1